MAKQSLGRIVATRFSRLRLGTTLVVLLGVIIAGTVGAVGYVSFRNGQEGVSDLAAQLQDSLQARIKQNLDEFLSKPHSLNRINAEALRSGLVKPRDFAGQRVRFLQQVKAFDSVITCAFGSAGGDFIGAGWRSEGVYDSALADKAVDNDYRVFILDKLGQPAELVSVVRDYNPRSRSWYQAALKTGQPTWSPIYVWASQANIGISAVLAVYDRSGALMGVQQSSLSLDHIGRFLGNLKIGESGQAFIVERSGMLVASPFEPSTRQPPGSQEAAMVRFEAAESASPLIRAAARHLTERYGSLDRINSDEKMRAALNGRNYFLNVTPFSDGRGLEWLITLIVPESDFMAHVSANARATLLMTISALIVAVSLGVFIARWVTQPIVKLNVAAQEMSRGRWQKITTLGRFDEVGQLTASFNRMGDQLQESFETLENRVRERTRELAAANERLYAENTERKEAEEAQRKSQQLFSTLFRVNPGATILSLLANGKCVDANEAYAKLTGYTRKELIGKTTVELNIWISAVERQSVVTELTQKGQLENVELTLRRKNGELINTIASGEVITLDGERYILSFFFDITERKRAEEDLRRSRDELEMRVQERTVDLEKANETLRHLSSRLLSAQEDESKRIAGDLHDTIGACLSGIKFKVENALQRLGKTTNVATKSLSTIIPLIQEGIEECRRIQMDLRPSLLDDLGLLATLSWFCRRFETIYSTIRIEREIGIEEGEIPNAFRIVIYRVTQEAMNNIAKHSKANLVRLSLGRQDNKLELVIQDNGQGFNLEKASSRESTRRGLGLTSMRERVELSKGSFKIESSEGAGTVIRASWPLKVESG